MTHLIELISRYGLLVVALNVLLDQIGLPLPAMPLLIVAGALTAYAPLDLLPLLLASVLACLFADSVWFLIGQRYGLKVLRTLCRISLEPDSCVSQTQLRFDRWGVRSIVIAKFVPGLAVIAPPLAGAMSIGWLRFIGLSSVAAFLWVSAGLVAGVLFHTQIERLLGLLGRIGSDAVWIVLAALLAYIAYKAYERARFKRLLRMARISVDELYELIEAGGEPIILDVRSHAARALEPHWIPGALHLPLDEVAARVESLKSDREIILYCNCPNEASAAHVARVLASHGFRRVRPLAGGLDAWVAAGHPVERASEPAEAPPGAIGGATGAAANAPRPDSAALTP